MNQLIEIPGEVITAIMTIISFILGRFTKKKK